MTEIVIDEIGRGLKRVASRPPPEDISPNPEIDPRVAALYLTLMLLPPKVRRHYPFSDLIHYHDAPIQRKRMAGARLDHLLNEANTRISRTGRHQKHADENRKRLAAAPPKVRARDAVPFGAQVSMFGIVGMPVEDDAPWEEILEGSGRYWSRLYNLHGGATGYAGMCLHIMDAGNWRGAIEVTEIVPDPAGHPENNIVHVKRIGGDAN